MSEAGFSFWYIIVLFSFLSAEASTGQESGSHHAISTDGKSSVLIRSSQWTSSESDGTKLKGKGPYVEIFLEHEIDLYFDIPVTYSATLAEYCLNWTEDCQGHLKDLLDRELQNSSHFHKQLEEETRAQGTYPADFSHIVCELDTALAA